MVRDLREAGTESLQADKVQGNVWRHADAVGVSVPTVKSVYHSLVRMNQEVGRCRQYAFDPSYQSSATELSTNL